MTTITDSSCVAFWLLRNAGITRSLRYDGAELWREKRASVKHSSSHIKGEAGRGFGADWCCSAVQQLISSWLPL